MFRYDEPDWDDYYDDYEQGDNISFADPGSNSALRAGTRNQPCPTCGWPNRLTPEDITHGYHCNSCADAMEGSGEIDYYDEHVDVV